MEIEENKHMHIHRMHTIQFHAKQNKMHFMSVYACLFRYIANQHFKYEYILNFSLNDIVADEMSQTKKNIREESNYLLVNQFRFFFSK